MLIVLAALDAKRPGPVAMRDIERILGQSTDAPVYGPNLRASCCRMEDAGWLRTLRAANLQPAVELKNAGPGFVQSGLLGIKPLPVCAECVGLVAPWGSRCEN